MAKYRGVYLHCKSAGKTIYVTFRDPRHLDKKRVVASLETAENGIAERIAKELSGLIYNPASWNDMKGLHPKTVEIWQPVQSEVKKAILSIPLVTQTMLQGLPDEPADMENNAEADQIIEFMEMEQKIRDLLEQVSILTSERDKYLEQLTLARGQLKKFNAKIIKNATPRKMEQAVTEFFASHDGTTAKGEWRDILKDWANRFAKEIGKEKQVSEVEPEDLIDHIKSLTVSDGTKKKLVFNLCRFMDWSSYRMFDCQTVKDAILPTLDNGNDEWYWLTNTQTKTLIINLKKKFGDYWSDAAAIQYGIGCRAEELAVMQSAKVFNDKDTWKIAITKIYDGNSKVRGVKTERSDDVVQVPQFAVTALQRRLKAKEFLLFPCYDENLLPRRARQSRTQFEIDNKLWTTGSEYTFSLQYKPRLLKAAEGIKDINTEKIDSRILRRTCARELILKYGYERAAAVIRDDVATLRKHYADLKASDTSTER